MRLIITTLTIIPQTKNPANVGLFEPEAF